MGSIGNTTNNDIDNNYQSYLIKPIIVCNATQNHRSDSKVCIGLVGFLTDIMVFFIGSLLKIRLFTESRGCKISSKTHVVKEATLRREFLSELGFKPIGPIIYYNYNLSAVTLVNDHTFTNHSKCLMNAKSLMWEISS